MNDVVFLLYIVHRFHGDDVIYVYDACSFSENNNMNEYSTHFFCKVHIYIPTQNYNK